MESSIYFVNDDSAVIPLSFTDVTSIFSKIVTGKIFGIKGYSNEPSYTVFGKTSFKNTIYRVFFNYPSEKPLYSITYRNRLYYITNGYIEDSEYHPLAFIGCSKENLIFNDTCRDIHSYKSLLYNTVYITEYLFNKENSGLLKLLQKEGFMSAYWDVKFSDSIKLSYSEADSLFIKPSLNTDRGSLINKSIKSMDTILLNRSNLLPDNVFINEAGRFSDSTYNKFKTTPTKDIKIVMSDYLLEDGGFFNCNLFSNIDNFVP